MSTKALPFIISKNKWILIPLGLMVLNALLWTAFGSLGGNPVLHSDSAEAYVWGREFQLGYYKHPPFWAWIAGIWFSVFPHKDWAFFLLSELNASLGIVGTWALLGRFTKGPERLAGTLLLLFTTFYTFAAFRYNANTAQLSLWPWAMYFFVISIERKTILSGITFGLLAAMALLSKYYAVLLLASCFVAALVHRDKRAYFKSPAPWAAFLAFMAAIAPNIIWLVHNDFSPFVYTASQSTYIKNKFAYTFFGLLVFSALYHVVQFAIVLFAKRNQRPAMNISLAFDVTHGRTFLLVLALAPFAITMLIRLAGFRVTPNYFIPIFSLTPFLLLLITRADAKVVISSSKRVYAFILVVCLMAAPFVPNMNSRTNEPLKPVRQVAQDAVNEWQKTIQAPLRYVSGTQPYSESLTFYAPGNVSEFTEFNTKYAPWVTKRHIEKEGMLVVCLTQDPYCFIGAAPYKNMNTITMRKKLVPEWGSSSESEIEISIIMIPPKERINITDNEDAL